MEGFWLLEFLNWMESDCCTEWVNSYPYLLAVDWMEHSLMVEK